MIHWSIEASDINVAYMCSEQCFFLILYDSQIHDNNGIYKRKSKRLFEPIILLRQGSIGSARIMMITTNGSIDIVPNRNTLIDVESSIGEWLYYIKNLVSFDIFTNITCT